MNRSENRDADLPLYHAVGGAAVLHRNGCIYCDAPFFADPGPVINMTRPPSFCMV